MCVFANERANVRSGDGDVPKQRPLRLCCCLIAYTKLDEIFTRDVPKRSTNHVLWRAQTNSISKTHSTYFELKKHQAIKITSDERTERRSEDAGNVSSRRMRVGENDSAKQDNDEKKNDDDGENEMKFSLDSVWVLGYIVPA